MGAGKPRDPAAGGAVMHPPSVYKRRGIAQAPTARLPMEGVIAATRYQSLRQSAGSSLEVMPGITPSWVGRPDWGVASKYPLKRTSWHVSSPGTVGAWYGCELGPHGGRGRKGRWEAQWTRGPKRSQKGRKRR